MSEPTMAATTPDRESEEWFLGQMDRSPLPYDELLGVLRHLAGRGASAQAESRARVLQDLLAEGGDAVRALEVLHLRAEWAGPADAGRLRADALAVLGNDRRRRDLAAHAGFDLPVPVAEALRRLRLLVGIREGSLCYDRTWGSGVVRRVDEFQQRLEIDFERKRGHQMSFAYAAESLRLLAADHLLARLHADPAGTRRLVAEDPAGLVRLALDSFGPLPVALLQEQLVPRLVEAGDWKRFWDAARKELKKDPRVVIPSKRTEPLEIRASAEDFGPAWFEALAAERDMPAVIERAEALLEAGRADGLDDAARRVLGERLAFVVKGAGFRHPALTARAAMAAVRGQVSSERVDVAGLVSAFLRPGHFVATLHALPARQVPLFLRFLEGRAGDALHERLLEALGDLYLAPFGEALDLLLGSPRREAAIARLRELVRHPDGHIEAVLWAHREPARVAEWSLVELPDLARLAVNAMEREAAGERLKAQNQLRERFARPEWLATLLGAMSEGQRAEFFQRVREAAAWPALERQALLGRLVKLDPGLQALLQQGASAAAAPAAPRRITSVRTYHERQGQLARLVGEEIPKNSREIAHARSYGDLSENFEYKAAKDMQRILMRRQEELEQQLREVGPSDFHDASADRAGQGTCVTVEHGDGSRERFCILGAWDRDEALHILSSEAKLALAVEGRRAGDEVQLPGVSGELRGGRVVSVEPLPEEVRRWARGEG